MDLREACRFIINNSPRTSKVEVFGLKSKSMNLKIEMNTVREIRRGYDLGLGIRIIHKNRMGRAYTTRIDDQSLLDTLQNAHKMSTIVPRDPRYLDFAKTAKYPVIKGTYDTKITDLDVKEILDFGYDTIQNGLDKDKNANCRGGIQVGWGTKVIVNTEGVDHQENGTILTSSIMAKIDRKTDFGVGFEYFVSRQYEPNGIIEVGGNAVKKALTYLGAGKAPMGKMPIIMDPLTTGTLFGALVNQGCNGLEILERRSYLVGKLNTQIASNCVTLIDNGLYPAGMGTSQIDGEGTPKQETVIIDDGILSSYIHNIYSANALKTKTTGNGKRTSYTSAPSISPSNLQLKPGDQKREEMIKDTKQGLLLDSANIRPNIGSGDISSKVDFGYYIENGEIKHPVMNTMIGTDIFTLLKGISTLSRETRNDAGKIFPSIKIEHVHVAS